MRTFYEVGEGLFTVERVAGFYFVYDCGGQRFDHNFDKGLVNQGMLCVVSCPIPCYKVKPCNVIKDIIANGGIELVTGLKGDITL